MGADAGSVVLGGQRLFRIKSETYAAEVASAQATVTQAEASLQNAQATVKRYESLEGVGVTTETLDTARVTALQAEATLSQARAALQVAQLDLDRTEIASPIEGIMAFPNISVGALVTANQTDALTTVTRIDPIYVTVEESSRRIAEVRSRFEAGALRPGDSIGLSLTLETGEVYEGEGAVVSPAVTVSETTGTQELRLRFDNPDRRILPGQFLRVDISIGAFDAILVPQGATSRASSGTLTAFVAVDGVAEERELTYQGSYENAWIVTEGVAPGDKLIVDGLNNLQAGAQVSEVAVTYSEDGVPVAADGQSEDFVRPGTAAPAAGE
ncbi:MAG: efflux RND transporter periplasmic adaptor subunit [Pseudomonadota bacterium]|nr:efflux RND transporter periplasmic adaptor subunit [Pseudomonadota bacterium]